MIPYWSPVWASTGLNCRRGGAFPAPGGSAAGEELTLWGWKRGLLAAYSYVAQDERNSIHELQIYSFHILTITGNSYPFSTVRKRNDPETNVPLVPAFVWLFLCVLPFH